MENENTQITINAVTDPKMHFPKAITDMIDHAINANLPVLLIGETGTGKTSLIRQLAKDHGKRLIRFSTNGNTGVDELLGKTLVDIKIGTYWQDGSLIKAMKNGDWFNMDELNMALPEILTSLHSLLDDEHCIMLKENNGEIVIPHPDFRFFGGINPCEDYAGTKELNKALVSRFPVVIEIGYSDKEREIIKERTGISDEDIDCLDQFAKEVRAAKARNELSFSCSTRDLIYAGKMIAAGLPMSEALKVAVVNKAPAEEKKPIGIIFKLVTGKDIPIKFADDSVKKYKSIKEIVAEHVELVDKAKEFVKEKKEMESQMDQWRKKSDDSMTKFYDMEARYLKVQNELDRLVKNSGSKPVKKKAVKSPSSPSKSGSLEELLGV